MYKCFICGEFIVAQAVKYFTADRTKIFCGAECSLKHYQSIKENKDGK
tara:strand:+ start:377 stop:520 length:144 start_codon:yes stop_codon:yes gene_type:complete